MSNTKPHISLFDKSYSENNTSDYDLFLQITRDGLKYLILENASKTFIGIEEFRFNETQSDDSIIEPIQEILTTNPTLQHSFRTFDVTYINNRSTLIPNAVFQKNKIAEYHQFNFDKLEEDNYYTDQLISLNANNIYTIPDFIIDAFSSIKEVTFKHFSSALIEASLLHAKTTKTPLLINVNVLPSEFQISIIKNQKLELYNSFTYQTNEDFIYYLLFALQQLNINNEDVTIRLLGEIEKESPLYHLISQYIKKITFGTRPSNLKYSSIFKEIPPHAHHSLFNQFLCE